MEAAFCLEGDKGVVAHTLELLGGAIVLSWHTDASATIR